jgi:uncharacterized protein YjdB
MRVTSVMLFGRTVRRATLLALTALSLTACGDEEESFTGPITRVEVLVVPIGTAVTNLNRGLTLQLRAVPVNGEENWVDTPVTWSTSDPSKATVDASGVVTTVGGGNVTISAATGGQTGTLDLNIKFAVGSVAITGGGATIRQEATVALGATVLGTDGVPATGRVISWTSSNPAVATVSAAGVVAGVTNGTVTITAESEGVQGTTSVTVSGSPVVGAVTVTPATSFRGVGQTVALSYVARAGSGTVIPGTTANWTTNDATVATVSASGVVTITGAGTATISATVDNGIGVNVVGTASVTGAPLLLPGAATAVPTVGTAAVTFYAYEVPAGATALNISASGGTGDADVYIFAPGVTPGTLNTSQSALAFANATQFSANEGNGETISRAGPAAGTWRIAVFAWGGAPAVTGLSLTASHTP